MHSKYMTKMESISQEHETPNEIFKPLDNEFNFEIDLCATKENAKCPIYYTKKDDCFTKDWNKTSWANIEFVRAKKYAKRMFEHSKKFGSTLVMLCTVKSNTNWWRDYVMNSKEVRFINGKVYFKGTKNTQGLRFPCAIVVFSPHKGDTKFSVMNQ